MSGVKQFTFISLLILYITFIHLHIKSKALISIYISYLLCTHYRGTHSSVEQQTIYSSL
jgi:hypothetical protein